METIHPSPRRSRIKLNRACDSCRTRKTKVCADGVSFQCELSLSDLASAMAKNPAVPALVSIASDRPRCCSLLIIDVSTEHRFSCGYRPEVSGSAGTDIVVLLRRQLQSNMSS